MGKRKDKKQKVVKRYAVKYRNKIIGYVWEESPGSWESHSLACEKYSGGLSGHAGIDTRRDAEDDVHEMHRDYTEENPDVMAELRFARKIIRRMKRGTNEFDECRAVANKALKRLDAFITTNGVADD